MSSPFDYRQPIAEGMKRQIDAHLAAIPEGHTAALVVLADVDEEGRITARAHVAARLGRGWRVAFEAGKPWDGPVYGQVMIAGAW